MKVCAVTTWPPHMDGIAQYSRELYTPMKDFIDIKIIANKLKTTNKSDEPYVERCWWRNDILYPFKIFHSILKEKPDLVHIQHGWLLYGRGISPLLFVLLLLMLRFKRIPTVVTIHTLVKKGASIHKNRLINSLAHTCIFATTKLIVKLSTKIILHTSLMKNFAINAYGLKKEDADKIAVIPHGSKMPVKMHEVSRENGDIKILSLGFIRKEKGMECLADAFNKVAQTNNKVKLIIIGGPHAHDRLDHVKYLKTMLSSQLEKVFIKGFVDEKTLDSLLYDCDIIVLTSLEHQFIEVSGVLHRIACYGKPVICSKVPKFTCELHDGEDCIMVEPCNSVSLADAILFLVKNPSHRTYLGEKLRRKFSSTHWTEIVEEHLKIYKLILSRG